MEDLSLHLLDIVENSLRARATRIEIRIVEERDADRLVMEVEDNGKGMDEEVKKRVLDPFFTTKPHRKAGLGLPLLAQSAEEAGGSLEIESRSGKGTKVKATFQLSHPDRRPLGDMRETVRVLRAAHPDVSFSYDHRIQG